MGEVMAKKVYFDMALNEARRRAIEKAHFPRRIREKYDIRIENGKLTIGEKK